jgi:hypothetical protein
MYDHSGWQDLQDMRPFKTTLMFRFWIFFFANATSSNTLGREKKNDHSITATCSNTITHRNAEEPPPTAKSAIYKPSAAPKSSTRHPQQE